MDDHEAGVEAARRQMREMYRDHLAQAVYGGILALSEQAESKARMAGVEAHPHVPAFAAIFRDQWRLEDFLRVLRDQGATFERVEPRGSLG